MRWRVILDSTICRAVRHSPSAGTGSRSGFATDVIIRPNIEYVTIIAWAQPCAYTDNGVDDGSNERHLTTWQNCLFPSLEGDARGALCKRGSNFIMRNMSHGVTSREEDLARVVLASTSAW